MTLEVAIRHRVPGFTLEADFVAPTPGVTVLFGPSGCGKTTTLAAIAGLLTPQAGRIAIAGRILLDTARRVAVPAERRRCGVVFQDARLFPHLSVASNLRYGLRRAPQDAAGPGMDEVVALLGLDPLLGRRPARLSGGERQRVALGRALLARPAILLMDEPLAALDDARKAEVLPYLARIRDAARIPILYVTHALDEVDQLADTLVLMQGGQVVASGPLEAIASRPDLPLAARRDAGAVIACTIQAHNPASGLSTLGFPGGTLTAPLLAQPPGTVLRLRLRARDVSIALTRPQGISIQNVLPVTVAAITAAPSPHEAMLTLKAGPTTLLSRVTSDAVSQLGLRPGTQAWALLKAVTFDQGRAVNPT